MDVDTIIKFDLSEVIGMSLDGFYDFLSYEAVGHECLMEISYEVIGVENGLLFVRVTGYTEEEE